MAGNLVPGLARRNEKLTSRCDGMSQPLNGRMKSALQVAKPVGPNLFGLRASSAADPRAVEKRFARFPPYGEPSITRVAWARAKPCPRGGRLLSGSLALERFGPRLTTGLQALKRQAVGDDRGRLATGGGAGEDFPQGVADALDMGIGLRGGAANALVVDVDDAACVDSVIRCPELVAPLQLGADLGRGQLVVGGPGDHRGAQHLQRLFVEDAAHGAGGEHVDVEAVDVLRTNHVGVQ